MYHIAASRRDLPQPTFVDPDPCALLVIRRANYLSYLRRHIGGTGAAEDVFQDFAVKVLHAVHDAQPISNTEAWLFRVLRNTLFDHYRRRDARSRAEAAYASQSELFGAATDADKIEAESEENLMLKMEAALASIRPDLAEVIRALYLRGIPREALAQQLQLEVGTLNVRAFRARRALRDALDRSASSAGNRGLDAASRLGSGLVHKDSASVVRETKQLHEAK